MAATCARTLSLAFELSPLGGHQAPLSRKVPGSFFLHCLASSPLLGTNGRLARWGNSRPPISPPRARPVIQGAVENGCALAFSAGALVNFPAHVGTITLCSQSGLSSRLQRTTMPKEHGEWRRRAPDRGRGSSVCRPPQPCGRHSISGGHQIDRFRYLLRQTVQQAPPQSAMVSVFEMSRVLFGDSNSTAFRPRAPKHLRRPPGNGDFTNGDINNGSSHHCSVFVLSRVG
jgi:hypothetical protein